MRSYPALPLGHPNRNGTSDALALTHVSRDQDANADFNSANQAFETTATAAGTTILTRASPPLQIFTGTTTQNVNLPNVATLRKGWRFHILNLSTGNVSIRTSAAVSVRTLVAGSNAIFTCILITGTGATTWNNIYSAITFGLAKSLLVSRIMELTALADNLQLNIGVVGGTLAHVAYVEPTGGYTVANLATIPDAGNTGDRTFVTDALAPVFGAIVAGTGAVFVPVYFDGANWRVG